MANPLKPIKGSQLLIKVGDGGTPEQFAHPCSINTTRGIQFTAETNDSTIPDCDNPDAIAWVGRDKKSLSATITGQGTLNAADQDIFFDWFESEDTQNVKVADTITGANGGRIYTGAFHLTQFEKTGTVGEKVTVNITLVSDGPVVKTNAA